MGNGHYQHSIDIIMEQAEMNLKQALDSLKIFKMIIRAEEIKAICKHIYEGLKHIHIKNVSSIFFI